MGGAAGGSGGVGAIIPAWEASGAWLAVPGTAARVPVRTYNHTGRASRREKCARRLLQRICTLYSVSLVSQRVKGQGVAATAHDLSIQRRLTPCSVVARITAARILMLSRATSFHARGGCGICAPTIGRHLCPGGLPKAPRVGGATYLGRSCGERGLAQLSLAFTRRAAGGVP